MPSVGGALHAQFLRRQQAGEATYLVAWAGARPVGSGLVRWAGHLDAASRAAMPDTPAISNLTVLPAWRGRGVGGELVAAAEQRIRDRGHRQVSLAVGQDNEAAARLYARLGYVDTWLREVSRYDVPEDTGPQRRVEEHNRLLRKRLSRS
ncbi:MAG: GNAT family N-acetyltransferase [Geodermatophilaceae bacterium]|nr:GNAT family N-acetyltransferase [Geodermatophilaceae bacterium]